MPTGIAHDALSLTALIADWFALSAIFGTALYSRSFHAMHEWLSMLLLAPFVLHLWKNWKPLLAYAKRKTLIIVLVLSAAAAPFILTAGNGGHSGNPASKTQDRGIDDPYEPGQPGSGARIHAGIVAPASAATGL
ncbi:MAG: hypothetical protein ABI268_01570 [Rhodanobacter sp.]